MRTHSTLFRLDCLFYLRDSCLSLNFCCVKQMHKRTSTIHCMFTCNKIVYEKMLLSQSLPCTSFMCICDVCWTHTHIVCLNCGHVCENRTEYMYMLTLLHPIAIVHHQLCIWNARLHLWPRWLAGRLTGWIHPQCCDAYDPSYYGLRLVHTHFFSSIQFDVR